MDFTGLAIKVALVLALVTGCFLAEQYVEGLGADKQLKKDTVLLDQVKLEASAKLLEANKRNRELELQFQLALDTQNLKDRENEKTIGSLQGQLAARAARDGGRLRDPNAAGCGGGGRSPEATPAGLASAGAADGGQAGGLLSAELTGLLQRLTSEADTINAAYASCKADALILRSSDSSLLIGAPAAVVNAQ